MFQINYSRVLSLRGRFQGERCAVLIDTSSRTTQRKFGEVNQVATANKRLEMINWKLEGPETFLGRLKELTMMKKDLVKDDG
jgi:hypothetical protein